MPDRFEGPGRRDRYGEIVDLDAPGNSVRKPHDRRCEGGWLGYDDERRPIPCLVCRPHLTRTSYVYDCDPSAR